MLSSTFSDRDWRQIREHGLNEEQIAHQLLLFKKGTPYVSLVRPCTAGDGILQFDRPMYEKAISGFEKKISRLQPAKFVPASGAATRMFKLLIRAYAVICENTGSAPAFPDKAGIKKDPDVTDFMNHIKAFAFYQELKNSMAEAGLDCSDALSHQQYEPILTHLLTKAGLNYAALPKGLILFHGYEKETRTAFEEHLVEAALYAGSSDKTADLYFTVSENHIDRFRQLFEHIRDRYESRYGIEFNVAFSIQEKHTDTLAVDMNNEPFRRSDGTLLFRPGGHGALIDNLSRINGDIIFIKNIDNVAHDRFKPEMTGWKKALAGHLLYLQENTFGFLKKLHAGTDDPDVVEAASVFFRRELNGDLPEDINRMPPEKKKETLKNLLHRPIRVCGMVPNAGDPGGGPFWVKDDHGRVSLQIVEMSQIDPASDAQQAIVRGATHFNPVDIVCGIRDWEGRPFDLGNFIDPGAVFISEKSEGGRDLKALEHPGLWNGAMAGWHTVFVEVPAITFNPVKQVIDLLKDAHQPA
jgi:hypothetical protein